MTVDDLRQVLARWPDDMRVVVSCVDGPGFDDVIVRKAHRLVLGKPHGRHEGRHHMTDTPEAEWLVEHDALADGAEGVWCLYLEPLTWVEGEGT